jgi:Zn-dependent protease with chaperone function
MIAEWYCQVEGHEFGPLTAEQLRGFAREGRLRSDGFVRRGLTQDWVPATQVKGLFDGDSDTHSVAMEDSGSSDQQPPARIGSERLERISSIKECISAEERKKRFGVSLVNGLVWLVLLLLLISTFGIIFVGYAVVWIINRIFAEYNVRKLMVYGTTAAADQFPEIAHALNDVCNRFEVKEQPRMIVINDSSLNAFAVKFAKKKVIVLLSETLEGILDKPAQLRFIVGHELAHLVLDHGARGHFEIYKPASYRAAREMTCDNAGIVSAGDLENAKIMLKRLGVGNKLYNRLNEGYLQAEARYIYSGITGWFLKQYLTYPPLGKRIANITQFCTASKPYR